MDNQQPVRQTAFSRDLTAYIRDAVRDERGLYHFPAAINDMLVTMGVPTNAPADAAPEAIRAVNDGMFRVTKQIQTALKWYGQARYDDLLTRARGVNAVHRDEADPDLFRIDRMELARFDGLVQSSTMNFAFAGKTQIKLLHFISTIYNDPAFFAHFQGRYPLKLILSIDAGIAVPRLINNGQEFRDFFLQAFFRIIAEADFQNAQAGGGIDYVPQAQIPDDGDLNIDEGPNGEILGVQEAPVIDRFPGLSISLLVIEFARMIQGRGLPKALKLPTSLSKSVICPNNDDQFCMIYCLIISSYIMREAEAYKKITNKLALNKLENFPLIQEKFDQLLPEFAELYDDDFISISEENLSELERIFQTNINVYHMVDGRARIIIRSSFSNVQTNHVTRLLFVPYSTMVAVKEKSNVKAYNLGSKTSADFAAEIDDDPEAFFSQNDGHFCLLTPNSPLISGEKVSDHYHMCPRCDSVFRGEMLFIEHRKTCAAFQNNLVVKTRMVPNEQGSCAKFTRFETLSKCPFVLYADTETDTSTGAHRLFSFWVHVKHESDPSLDLHYSLRAQKESQIGNFMVRQFARYLTAIRVYLRENTNLYPDLNPEECAEFLANNKKERCHFCNQVPATKEGVEDPDLLVVHHDHNRPSPGNIVGFLCRSCNRREGKVNNSFPIVFHNMSYDALVLVRSLAEKQYRLEIDGEMVTCNLEMKARVLAKTSMKYSSITLPRERMLCTRDDLSTFQYDLPEIRFTDSYAFLSESLEKLVEGIADQTKSSGQCLKAAFPSTWSWVQQHFPSVSEELFTLSTAKGLIAYDHTTIEAMNSKTNLPREYYRSDLCLTDSYLESLRKSDPELAEQLDENDRKKNASLDKDYAHSNAVFDLLAREYGEKGMNYGMYFSYYNGLDVALLSDVFTRFRNTIIPTHKLDPAWYIGLPSYSQNCMLYLTQKVLHFIPENLELSQLITANLRGGLSVILSKLAEAATGKHIASWDISNLYGWAMIQKIANRYVGEITVEVFENEIEPKYKGLDDDFAYFCLCDVDCSDKDLQDRVVLLPPLVSSKQIRYDDLSEHQAAQKEANYRSEKLVCSLDNQEDYLMNLDNLNFYERLGYVITIKRVFKFEKGFTYRDYIDLNSALRKLAASGDEFSKALYKLLNNIIYGKSLQRNDLRTEIEILSDPKLIHKRLINPRLKAAEVIRDNELIMIRTTPKVSKFDTCCQAGFHILELSKLRIYSIIHEQITPFCRKNKVGLRFLYSDTDSLGHELDFTEQGCSFANYEEYTLAFSAEFPNTMDNHMWLNPKIKDTSHTKEVGRFLDEEVDRVQTIGYVGLCSKSYCLLMRQLVDTPPTAKEQHKAGDIYLKVKGKGVPGRYLSALYRFEDYKACVLGDLPENRRRVEFKSFRKQGYENTTVSTNKVALSSFDDKMFHYQEDGVFKSLPHEHYKIAEIRKN